MACLEKFKYWLTLCKHIMVDFNSEGAFTANKAHILELVILGRRDELINTFQLWRENKLALTSKEEGLRHKLRSVFFAIFLELERPLSRKLDQKKFDELKGHIFAADLDQDQIVDDYLVLNKALDELNLIRIDNKKSYDTTSVESENSEKGL